ncbi:MAG: T9SS type A sorting domain-containing protein [Crocinitomicaceae bacterium]|nr:T9SS type A sorting domain-containing protein [Crocinitomicaceae bacterium]
MKFITAIALFFTVNTLFSQIQGDKFTHTYSTNSMVFQSVTFPKPNLKQLRAEDEENDVKGLGPWRFGYNFDTDLSLDNAGTWTTLSNGGKLWLLKIQCNESQTINLTLENTFIPEGNELFVYNEDKSFILGKFTEKHVYKGQLGTELVPGSTVIVEYYVAPQNILNSGRLTIKTVTYGYRSAEEFQEKAFGSAAFCHKNVNCPEGLPFSNQKRSVVMLVSGSNGFCTGALVNNTSYDGKPYVLTANHCYSNPASWIFRFNWESPDCTNPGTSPAFTSLSGADLRSRRAGSDFCLVEITGGLESGTIPSAYNAYFSGWDRTGDNPSNTFGIHHPKGDIKKISFDDNMSFPAQTKVGATVSDVAGTWRVQWDRSTTTEGGSSGSPLFNQNKRIIGQLWGGGALCTNPDGFDYYGRFSVSWDPSGSNSTNHLKTWLDPTNTGALVVNGYEPSDNYTLDASLVSLKNVNGTLCSNSIAPKFTLVNTGTASLTSATITYGFDGVESQTYTWSGNLAFLAATEIDLPNQTVAGGGHSFSATVTTVNGGADAIADNNNIISQFYVVESPQTVNLAVTVDCYASETSWQITNSSNDTLYKSPIYYNTDEGLHNYSLCLDPGCYTFKVFDEYNDGMSYCDSGLVVITGSLSEILAQITKQEAATFGASKSINFCVDYNGIENLTTDFGVFPNPVQGMLMWNSKDVVEVALIDLAGQLIVQAKTEQNQSLSVGGITNGVYFASFKLSNGTVIVKKIVVEKN